MPKYERYPNESPAAAKQRIAKNVAQNKGGVPPGLNRPAVPSAVVPEPTAVAPAPEMAPRPEARPRTRRRPGYNFTRNIGNKGLPDVGY